MSEEDEYWLFLNEFTGHDWEFNAYGYIEESLLMEMGFGEVRWSGEMLLYGELECVSVVSLGFIHTFLS
jgi:hypothetical protein